MSSEEPFYIQKGNLYLVPILHYNLEFTSQAKIALEAIQPDCIAVELPETMQLQMLHAASRLPDISVIKTYSAAGSAICFMSEPCDALFEGLRTSLEKGIPGYCIDLDVDGYPEHQEALPDSYAVQKIGLKPYYELYAQSQSEHHPRSIMDMQREAHMAKRLKELSFRFDKVIFLCGMAHLSHIFRMLDLPTFTNHIHASRDSIELVTITPNSSREILAEWGYLSEKYEIWRKDPSEPPLDRQKIIYQLYKQAAARYKESTGNSFPGYHYRNIMKFLRNYALIRAQLMPNLFQLLTTAKCCVDHNYAYEVWELATSYPHLRNIDNLPAFPFTVEEIWGASKQIKFHLREKGRKDLGLPSLRKDRAAFKFNPPGPFTICSYQPEDVAIERFGEFLKKKGKQILTDEVTRTIPFSTSIEEGIDTKETIRHWHEHKLYVKAKGKPPQNIGSVCIIFDEDKAKEGKDFLEKYLWKTTWIGEHNQESDMSFYATPITRQVVGPGISRCEYGGFLLSYPPQRLRDVWRDPDYQTLQSKPEVLLVAGIDYAIHPVIVYVAASPPRSQIKSYARRFGKKIVFIPIGQLSPVTLNQLRVFHVLDGKDKRKIADEYIY